MAEQKVLAATAGHRRRLGRAGAHWRVWGTSLALLGAVVAAIRVVSPTARRAELVVVGPKRTDFGAVEQGRHLQATFAIRNCGRSPTWLEAARTSCSCFEVRLLRNPLPAGAVSLVTAELDTSSQSGAVTAVASVGSREGRSKVRLELAAKVLPAVQAVPAALDLGSIPFGQRREATVKLSARRSAPIDSLSWAASEPCLVVDWRPEHRLGPSTILVSLDRPPLGPFDGSITLEVPGVSSERLVIPVRGCVVAPRAEVPTVVFVGFVRVGARARREAVLRGWPAEDFAGAWTDQVGATVTARRTRLDAVSLLLDYAPVGSTRGELRSSLFVETRGSRAGCFRIPLVGSVWEPGDCNCGTATARAR